MHEASVVRVEELDDVLAVLRPRDDAKTTYYGRPARKGST